MGIPNNTLVKPMLLSRDSTILQAQKPGRRRIVSQGCDPLIQNTCFGCVLAEFVWENLENVLVFFTTKNLQLVYPPPMTWPL